ELADHPDVAIAVAGDVAGALHVGSVEALRPEMQAGAVVLRDEDGVARRGRQRAAAEIDVAGRRVVGAHHDHVSARIDREAPRKDRAGAAVRGVPQVARLTLAPDVRARAPAA